MRSFRSQIRRLPLLIEEEQESPVRRGTQLLDLAPVGREGPGDLVALGIEGAGTPGRRRSRRLTRPRPFPVKPSRNALAEAVIQHHHGRTVAAIRQTRTAPIFSVHAARYSPPGEKTRCWVGGQ